MWGRLPSGRAERLPRRTHPPDPTAPPPRGGQTRRPPPRLDVVAVGNALVDVLATATGRGPGGPGPGQGHHGHWWTRTARRPSTPPWGPTTEASGGSAANTVAGVAALGRPGRLPRRGWPTTSSGQAFTHDIRSIGVAFDPKPTPAGARPGGDRPLPGAGDRGRRAHHGHPPRGGRPTSARSTCTTATCPRPRWSTSRATCGSSRRPRRPCVEAIDIAHGHDASVALTVSDPFCVEHHQARVPRAAQRRPRAAVRQRGGDQAAVRVGRLRRRGGGGWRDRRTGRADPGGGRVGRGDGVGAGGGAGRAGRPGGRHHRGRRPLRRRIPLRDHQRAVARGRRPGWAGCVPPRSSPMSGRAPQADLRALAVAAGTVRLILDRSDGRSGIRARGPVFRPPGGPPPPLDDDGDAPYARRRGVGDVKGGIDQLVDPVGRVAAGRAGTAPAGRTPRGPCAGKFGRPRGRPSW